MMRRRGPRLHGRARLRLQGPFVLGLLLPLCLALGSATCAAGEPAPPPARAAAETAPAGQAPAGHHPAGPEAREAPGPGASDDATARHPFDDAEKWAKIFDDPGRDAWQKPEQTIAALGIRPGMVAADLGAGTGYFSSYLSKAVGPGGMVLAIDPEPEMVGYLGRRARKDGLTNVVPVLGLTDEPFLPKGRVDRVLIADTYHHIDDRLEYFGRMREALAPGGRVAVVDFHKRPLPVGPPPEHKLSREHVLDEMQKAGWRLAEEKTFLPYQYFLIFEPAAPGTGPGTAPGSGREAPEPQGGPAGGGGNGGATR
jgi:ubiquinone/menaquinone biosynthesis C-methylase UbiE